MGVGALPPPDFSPACHSVCVPLRWSLRLSLALDDRTYSHFSSGRKPSPVLTLAACHHGRGIVSSPFLLDKSLLPFLCCSAPEGSDDVLSCQRHGPFQQLGKPICEWNNTFRPHSWHASDCINLHRFRFPLSSSASQQIRVESFVSRDILDKTMGSNVPVLRHLAEEAAQQKSRHVALVYGECGW